MIEIRKIKAAKPVVSVQWDGSDEALAEIRELVSLSNKSMEVDSRDNSIALKWFSTKGLFAPCNTTVSVYIGDYIYLDKNKYQSDERHLYMFRKEEVGNTWEIIDKMEKKEEFVFFWGGNFSQWAPSKFVIDGVEFNTCEQYMMYKKALMFFDYEMAEKIMQEKNPREQKALGRQVTGFEKKHWDKYCRQIVYDGNVAKFTQNKELFAELMATGDKTMVEASAYDNIWGIGLADTNPLIHDRKNWKGSNWLGIAIEQVREDIKSGKIEIEWETQQELNL